MAYRISGNMNMTNSIKTLEKVSLSIVNEAFGKNKMRMVAREFPNMFYHHEGEIYIARCVFNKAKVLVGCGMPCQAAFRMIDNGYVVRCLENRVMLELPSPSKGASPTIA